MTWLDTAEHRRLAEIESRHALWRRWGPYLSERAWGTVREDYSPTGEAWEYFSHEQARSRAYRWHEDGLGGISNDFQNICLAVALWNERDPILKERFFGLTGNEGNHGEDVKEYYYYLDSTPTHSYMRMLYKYPQAEYPYDLLVVENRQRGQGEPEFELIDALAEDFEAGRYFDVFIEYAKASEEDILCRITAINRGPDAAPIHILPHIWYRNTWSWGYHRERPLLKAVDQHTIYTGARHLGERWWWVDDAGTALDASLLFTENETNYERLFDAPNRTPFVKDGINEAVLHGRREKVNPAKEGTKAAAHVQALVPPGESVSVRVRFAAIRHADPFTYFDEIFDLRQGEADEFYAAIHRENLNEDERLVQRQAFAGLLWTKQFYHYSVELWLKGDPAEAAPPPERQRGRNAGWQHLESLDVLSMPDKWEYPWFAAWDLAFHTLPIALVDPEWAKQQIILLLREWYMHPNGQIPAYEWAFGDVNPPVHAWAALRVYEISRDITGIADTDFLERVFHKLMLNFTWWVNRKDHDDNNVFQGGFLGLDNIGVFDRSAPLPHGGHIDQADGTAWMGMYSLNMLTIALELAQVNPAYEDVATKFFEHFIYIANAINHLGGGDVSLWNEEDKFFYDVLHLPNDRLEPMRVRSFVGLIPLFAVATLEPEVLERLPQFRRRMEWFIEYRPHLVANVASLTRPGEHDRRLLAIAGREQLAHMLACMLDTNEFLCDYGLRSLSRHHIDSPYVIEVDGSRRSVDYEPAESSSGLFGGNSNWRGPIWLPVNYLMIEALKTYHSYCGDDLLVELPTGSGHYVALDAVAAEIGRRLIHLFLRDETRGGGRRPVFGGTELFQTDPHWRDLLLFYEYFHGDNGAGIGASHQTGWTALVANLLQEYGNGANMSAADLADQFDDRETI